ncbi:MAG: hypothetical protein ABI647_18545 [Gemmatimonadota bacterium]
MAERIKARIGDIVETSFNLAFKKAEVARLPDAAQHKAFDFFVINPKAKKIATNASNNFGERGLDIKAAAGDVTQDDQAVTAQFRFANDQKAGEMVKVGEVWQLFLFYCGAAGESPPSEDDPRSHLLAEVEIVGPAAKK